MSKVEFQLTLDDRKALEAIRNTQARIEQTQRKLNEAGKDGSKAFDGVGDSLMKMAGTLGIAGGAGAAFQMTLQKIREEAAAINREAQASLEIGRSTSSSFGSFISNNPGISPEQANAARAGLQSAIQAFPQQGGDAMGLAFGALEASISAAPRLTQEARLGAVQEALQARTLNRNLDLGMSTAGIASLMQNFGLSPDQASNAIIASQSQSRVQSFQQVASGLARVAPGINTSGIDPLQGMAMFAYGTGVLEDTTGEQTATNVSQMLTRLTTRGGRLEEATGMRFEGDAMERLNQFVEARRSGRIGDDQFAKALPIIAEGQGQNLILSMIADGGAGYQQTLSAIQGANIMGGDALGGMLGAAQADPTFSMTGRALALETQASLIRSGDVQGQTSSVVRNAMLENLRLSGVPDRLLENAGEVYDARIALGFTPASAAQRGEESTRGASSLPMVGGLFRSFDYIYDTDDFGAGSTRTENGRVLPGAATGSAEYLEQMLEKMGEQVERGMTRALQNVRTRQPLEANQ